jgi:hypothetical protein
MGAFGDLTAKIKIPRDDILDRQRYLAYLIDKRQQVKVNQKRLDKPEMC